MEPRVATTIIGAALVVASSALAQVAPLANTSVAAARIIVPDGSSLLQPVFSPGEQRWFVFGAEPGKTYVVDVVDASADFIGNSIGGMGVTDASGVSSPPEADVDCGAGYRAPGLTPASDGARCVVRTFPPSPGNAQNKRALYVGVTQVTGPGFHIRVRESTIYGRWTTNGYDFNVQLENTTADWVCAEVQFLPNAGEVYTGTWSGAVITRTVNIAPFGSGKYVLPNGTLVGTDNKGTLRIGACPSATATVPNLVPDALHVSTYAYNPVTDKFLYFFANTTNNGATSNTW